MRSSTRFSSFLLKSGRLRGLRYLVLLWWLAALPARASGPGAAPTLAQALNPDGTLRPGAQGSFDARQFQMETAPDGRPVFRPAGTAGAGDEKWLDGFGPVGSNTIYPYIRRGITAIVCSGTDVYVGGYFTSIGTVAARCIARWDGTSWHPLGTGLYNGLNGPVFSMALAPNGSLYVGGFFSEAGGAPASGVVRWDGSSWRDLGANVSSQVNALAVAANGDLYAGGTFTQASGQTVNGIARWNGTSWSSLGAGLSGASGVRTSVAVLAIAGNGDLYAGGSFTQSGNTPVNYLAKWNGSSWSGVGGLSSGTDLGVSALAFGPGGELYAAGSAVNSLAKWNGTTWTNLSSGLGLNVGLLEAVYALAVAGNGDLYVSGSFSTTGAAAFHNVARWNGSSWSALGAGIGRPGDAFWGANGAALAIAGSGTVYVGGFFGQAGSVVVNNLAAWNGSSWHAVGPTTGKGVNGRIYAVAVAPTGEVYVGGEFSTAGALAANNVARWNGSSWSLLGTGSSNGVDGPVNALVVAPAGELYAGGRFLTAGGVPTGNVAKWNGSSWTGLGFGGSAAADSAVRALALAPTGDLYVTGGFMRAGQVAASRIARWNGSSWASLGSGLSGGASASTGGWALAVSPGGELYVCGDFTTAGGVVVNHVAKWNGSGWSALAFGLQRGLAPLAIPGRALALAANGDLYVGGTFSMAGLVPAGNVARWDGSSWYSIGNVPGNGLYRQWSAAVTTLAVSSTGDLYAGGGFDQGAGTAARNIAHWDGSSWSSLGTGLDNDVSSLALGATGQVYVGGGFGGVSDGSKPSVGFAVYDPTIVAGTSRAATEQLALRLYPNPAHGPVTLTLAPAPVARLVQVLDALGRLVRTAQVPAQANSLPLSTAGLPAGTYTVRCGQASTHLVVE